MSGFAEQCLIAAERWRNFKGTPFFSAPDAASPEQMEDAYLRAAADIEVTQ